MTQPAAPIISAEGESSASSRELRLSANFGLSEFVASQIAARFGIYNMPTGVELSELRRVAQVLEQVRGLPGIQRPIFISSGYRCYELNRKIGGARNSAHTKGRAADITVPGMSPLKLCQLIAPQVDVLGIDQLIFEGAWAHIAIAALDQPARHQVLTAAFTGKSVSYSVGLPA